MLRPTPEHKPKFLKMRHKYNYFFKFSPKTVKRSVVVKVWDRWEWREGQVNGWSTKDVCENILYDTLTDTHHCIFIQMHRMYTTKSEL